MTRIVLFVGICFVIAFADGVVAPENDARTLYEGSQLLRVVAPTKKLKDEILKLEDSGDLNLWSELARNNSNVDVLVKPTTESKVKEYFKSHNLEYEILIENLQDAIDAENPKLSDEEIEELVGRKGHRMTWQQYHRLSDIHGYLDYLGQTFPDLCSVQSIGNSIEGRPLKLIKISSGKPNAPAIWIDGGVHAREWISPASVTYLINELVENRDAHGPHIQGVDFYIIPVSNPDGYEHSHTKDRLWRKNRGNAVAGACGGIDLNRNFGYKWGGPGSSKQPCKETYAGTGQFSEPETQGISRFVLANSQNIKQELKIKESQIEGALPLSARRITVAEASEKEILTDQLKGKDVHISQLNAKIEELQNEKKHSEESTDSLKLANVQMQGEIERNKKLIADLKSRDTSQAMDVLQKELDAQKADSAKKSMDIDRLHRDLRRTSEELEARKVALKAMNLESKKNTDMWNEKLKELQLELDEERAYSEEERRKHNEDEEKIERLSKEVKEIEQLLKTNHPNSIPVPTLPVSAEGDARKKADTPRIKFLEDRIRQLEDELESATNVLDSGFEGIQVQYKALKDKYDMNTEQLTKELAAWKKEAAAWKETAQQGNIDADANKHLKEYAVSQKIAKPHLFANAIAVKEDAHLIATIRGLKNELIAKDRSIRGLEKKLSEAMKTNKRLQVEREKVLAQPVITKAPAKITPPQKVVKRVEEFKDMRPEMHSYLERQKELEYSVSQLKDSIRIKDSQIELLTIELREVRERRLRDLEELQEEHEEEIAELMSENSPKHFHNRFSEMDGKLHGQEQEINRLKEQLKALDEHRAENLVLKVEREHLERSLKEATKKLTLLRQSQSPDQTHYEALLDKIADLELRHESREQNLQAVVRDLLRTKSDQGDSSTLREQLSQKNRELSLYKSEMNKIIGKVRFLENELIGQEPKANSGRR